MSHAVVLVVVDGPREKVEEQIAEQMAPFQEESWFEDGSRWDWYQLGGRYVGWIDNYDPEQDPNNYEVCDLCSGTGRRVDMHVANGCNGCGGKGIRLKWPSEWKANAGDIMQIKDVRSLKREKPLSAYAFLHDKHWHEAERLGWFGCSTATECERKNPAWPLDNSKCLHVDPKTGARIVNWQEPHEIWDERFYQRFIDPLADDKYLVVVDYHI